MKPRTSKNDKDKLTVKMTLADAFDNYVSWLVLWLFLTSINLAMEASSYLISEEVGSQVQSWAQIPSRVGIFVILIAIIVFTRRRRRLGWKCGDRGFMDGYTMDIVKRSALVSFFVTFLTIGLLDNVTNNTQQPADFFIKIPGFTLAITFSLCFFYWNRNAKEEPDEEVLP